MISNEDTARYAGLLLILMVCGLVTFELLGYGSVGDARLKQLLSTGSTLLLGEGLRQVLVKRVLETSSNEEKNQKNG